MGTLADGNLRHKRILAHKAFDKVQKYYGMDKDSAYLWLQLKLNLGPDEAHIGMFSLEMCDKVISICHKILEPSSKAA